MAVSLYGFIPEQWQGLKEIEKQKVRNWAYEFAYSKYGGGTPPPETLVSTDTVLPKNLRDAKLALQNTGNRAFYDEVYGQFEYPYLSKFTDIYFGNTKAALHRDKYTDLQREVDRINTVRNRTLADERKVVFNKMRMPQRTSYSGCDITPSITVGDQTFIIGNISTLTYSIHRDLAPVRTLGRAYPKSYVAASRTIAGSLIFHVFDTHVLHDIRKAIMTEVEATGLQSSPLTDQLPPFDITILFHNEYGDASYMRIYGVQISDEGQTHSVNDIFSENVMQYVARDIDLMVKTGDEWTPQALAGSSGFGLFQSDAANQVRRMVELEKNLGIAEKDLIYVRQAIKDVQTAIDEDVTFSNEVVVQYTIHLSEDRRRDASYFGSDWTDTLTQLKVLATKLSGIVDKLKKERDALNLKLTESGTQAEAARLGSLASSQHDNPYAITRKLL